MHTVVVGLNYKTAPVEIREKFSFIESELPTAMEELKKQKSVLENVIVSTCNRTEIYAVVDQLNEGEYYIKQFLAKWFNVPVEQFDHHLFIYEQDASLNHLFKVIAGIDSMVLGETQILGQVRKSFLEAQKLGATGAIYNKLFKQAVTFAKRAHSETSIGENAVSVSYAAVELAKKIFGSLNNKHVAILGAGKMGELAIQNLYGSGISKVTVINRTFEKAQTLAAKFEGNAKSMNELQCSLLEADILISSTGSTNYCIDYNMMKHVAKMRKADPLFIVDIAVPRDIDPKIADLPNVFLYDIDDLQGIVQANLVEREKAASQIALMIDVEIQLFNEWLAQLGVGPVINALSKKANRIQEETMVSIMNKMPGLTEREQKILNKHTKSIINQLLKDPILQAKEMSGSINAAEQLKQFQRIFGIEYDVEKDYEEQNHQAQRLTEQEAINRRYLSF